MLIDARRLKAGEDALRRRPSRSAEIQRRSEVCEPTLHLFVPPDKTPYAVYRMPYTVCRIPCAVSRKRV